VGAEQPNRRGRVREPLPVPTLVFPVYTIPQIFEVFSMFLSKHEFTYTRRMLSKVDPKP
jgi:hypothetical protein